MAKIFQRTQILEKRKYPKRRIAYPLEIESAELREKAFGKEDGLFLILKNGLDEHSIERINYEFVGKEIHDAFIQDMGLNNLQALKKEYVTGFLNEDGYILYGLAPYKKT